MIEAASRNIILVDDDPVTIQLCNMIFKRTLPDANITAFENGLEALKWIADEEDAVNEDEKYVLLLDLNMPELDGWEFLDAYEEIEETIRRKFRIYILTSSKDKSDIKRSTEYTSVSGFYSKPLTHKMIDEIFAETDGDDEGI